MQHCWIGIKGASYDGLYALKSGHFMAPSMSDLVD